MPNDKMSLNDYAKLCHAANQTWWHDPATGEKLKRNKGEMIALMHSELSEMLEGVRKRKKDDHLPDRSSEEVELIDLFIRAFDYAAAHNLDLDGAFLDKMDYNQKRADHKPAARLKDDGKQF